MNHWPPPHYCTLSAASPPLYNQPWLKASSPVVFGCVVRVCVLLAVTVTIRQLLLQIIVAAYARLQLDKSLLVSTCLALRLFHDYKKKKKKKKKKKEKKNSAKEKLN